MVGYGIGAFAVGPLRQVGNLQLSEVYLGAIGIASVLIVLALALTRQVVVPATAQRSRA